MNNDRAKSAQTNIESPGSIKTFESAIAELEKIVKQLEEGDLPLEKSLALFERGVELSRYCHDQLGAAQRRIELLTERGEMKDATALVPPDEQ
jgi:exodeoxyribonuclease VII small subunit